MSVEIDEKVKSVEKQEMTGVKAESSSQGVFLPVAILMVAVLLVLGWNLYLAKSQAAIWKKQIAQREQAAGQARAVQADLRKIAHDLMSLSLTDAEARAIVEKYQIKQAVNSSMAVPKP